LWDQGSASALNLSRFKAAHKPLSCQLTDLFERTWLLKQVTRVSDYRQLGDAAHRCLSSAVELKHFRVVAADDHEHGNLDPGKGLAGKVHAAAS
jgi:hypothetical protein